MKIPQQHVLKALAQWREEAAQSRDIPRTWVLRDDKLYDLATQRPKTEQAIREMDVFGKKSVKYFAAEVSKLISGVQATDERVWRKFDPLTKEEKSFCSTLMKKMADFSQQYEIAQALLGTRKDIESLYRNRSSKRLLRGWREDLIGKPLLELIRQQSSL